MEFLSVDFERYFPAFVEEELGFDDLFRARRLQTEGGAFEPVDISPLDGSCGQLCVIGRIERDF